MIHLLKALFLGKLLHDRHRHRKHETWYFGSNVTNIMTLLEISYFVMFYSKRCSLTCRIHTPNGTNVRYGPIYDRNVLSFCIMFVMVDTKFYRSPCLFTNKSMIDLALCPWHGSQWRKQICCSLCYNNESPLEHLFAINCSCIQCPFWPDCKAIPVYGLVMSVCLSVRPSVNILVKVSGWGKISAMNRDTGLILGM